MRTLELLLVLVNVPTLMWFLSGRPVFDWLRLLPAMALLVFILHIIIEGIRWHLAPAYLVTVLTFLAWSCPTINFASRWAPACGIGCLAIASIFGSVLPVFAMPKPTGPNRVGTVTLHLIDTSRKELLGETSSGHRELMVQVWYPSDQSGPGKPYRLAAEVSFPKDHLALVKTHAAEGVPLANSQSRYPIVLFSPSWIGRRNQNTIQAVELASHGFVVVGVDHPFSTDMTIFPDGRHARTILGEALDYSSNESHQQKLKFAEEQVRLRAADVRFVLDYLERASQSDPMNLFTGRLDTSRTAVFGHSFGGSVAAEVCSTDSRVQRGANLDGLVFGESLRTGFLKPFLVIETAIPCPSEAQIAVATGSTRRQLSFIAENTHAIRRAMKHAGGYWVSIRGTTHMNYCDSPLYTPIRALSHSGPIAPNRAWEIINLALVEFLHDLHPKGNDVLNALPARFPEIEFERICGDNP